MPVYTYHCENCNHEFDQRQSFSDENLTDCPNCEQIKVLYKIYKPAQIVFKGSGYYVTDNRSKKSTMNSTQKSETNNDNKGGTKDSKAEKLKSKEAKTTSQSGEKKKAKKKSD